LAFIDER
jgi:hypothetical protein